MLCSLKKDSRRKIKTFTLKQFRTYTVHSNSTNTLILRSLNWCCFSSKIQMRKSSSCKCNIFNSENAFEFSACLLHVEQFCAESDCNNIDTVHKEKEPWDIRWHNFCISLPVGCLSPIDLSSLYNFPLTLPLLY